MKMLHLVEAGRSPCEAIERCEGRQRRVDVAEGVTSTARSGVTED